MNAEGAVTTAEVGEGVAAIAAEGGALAGAVGATALAGGLVVAGAAIVLGIACLAHWLPVCKKRVCADPNGNWHSHQSHCQGRHTFSPPPTSVRSSTCKLTILSLGGCWDRNHYWHRHPKHCRESKYRCQDKHGYWHHHEKRCHGDSCIDPNNKCESCRFSNYSFVDSALLLT